MPTGEREMKTPLPVPTPCYLVDCDQLRRNLQCLATVASAADCKILLALKAFALPCVFPLVRKYLHGASASSGNEARLARTCFGGELHFYTPVCTRADVEALLALEPDCFTFNSDRQRIQYQHIVAGAGCRRCGIRIRPARSGTRHRIYNTCGPLSHFGMPASEVLRTDLKGVNGALVHIHTEDNFQSLADSVDLLTAEFGFLLERLQWLNLGGGQLITAPDYDLAALCDLLRDLKRRYGLEIYLEPGQAVVLNAGFLITTVLEIVDNEVPVAIVDASAIAHLPDFVHTKYSLHVSGAGPAGTYPHRYRLVGRSCSSLDVLGEFSFATPLEVGMQLAVENQADYTLVQANTFNGIDLPSVALMEADTCRVVKTSGYEEYRRRWGD
jgi:carboxynorspermidine decarboxylase